MAAQNTPDDLNDLESDNDFEELDTDNLDDLDPSSSSKTGDGLTKEEKQLLLKCVDKKGGLSFCTRETGIVEEICNWEPSVFGIKKSPKRKSTQNIITKWKAHTRNNKFYKVREWLDVPKPKNVSDSLDNPPTSTTTTRTTRATTKKTAPTTTTTTETPAPVKSIELQLPKSMSSITSPARIVREKKATAKAEVTVEGASRSSFSCVCTCFLFGSHADISL